MLEYLFFVRTMSQRVEEGMLRAQTCSLILCHGGPRCQMAVSQLAPQHCGLVLLCFVGQPHCLLGSTQSAQIPRVYSTARPLLTVSSQL